MSSNSQKDMENQEIDLSQISKIINNFFESISSKIYRAIVFIRKNIKILMLLFIIGATMGYLMDKSIKKYDNLIIVTPNFGSIDYLYSKINLINAKIEEGDTIFLKETVGIKEPKLLKVIEVEPITDVYKFIDNQPENFELIKLIAEDGDIEKVIEDYTTSKNYPFHVIEFSTSKKTSNDKTVEPILAYLNDSDYYKAIQKEYLNNIELKMTANDTVISQIDGVLNSFSSAVNGSQRNDKLIYYNENTQLNDVIRTKNDLINEQGSHRINLVNLDKIIKDNISTINTINTNFINSKKKFILPILFVFVFIIIGYFKSFLKKQVEKNKL